DNAHQTDNGRWGKAFSFDGINDYIDIAADASLNYGTNDITVSLWYRPSREGLSTAFEGIFSQKGVDDELVDILVYCDGRGRFQIKDELGNQVQSSSDAGDAEHNTSTLRWHHMVMVVDRQNDTGRLYLNKAPLSFGGTTDIDISSVTGIIDTDNFNRIGRISGAFFNGSVDDVQIHRRAFSWEEINATYNADIHQYSNRLSAGERYNYTYTAYAQDQAGNLNETETRQIQGNSIPRGEIINLTPNYARTYDYLDCRFNSTDDDGDVMQVNITWWKNSVGYTSDDENFTAEDGVVMNTTSLGDIEPSDTSKGDNWTCSINLHDGHEWSGWINSSPRYINDTLPSFFIYSYDGNTLLLDHCENAQSTENLGGKLSGTLFEESIAGNGLKIDGADIWTFGSDNNINITQGSFEAWVYVNESILDTGENRYVLRVAENEAHPYNNTLALRHGLNSNWELVTVNQSGNSTIISYHDTITPEGWHHLGITWDSVSSNLSLFIDGALVNSTASARMPGEAGSLIRLGHFSNSLGQIDTVMDEILIKDVVKDPGDFRAKGLVRPSDNNNSLFNRTPVFQWNSANDPDGDSLTYKIKITPVSLIDCPVFVEQTGISSLNYTPQNELCVDMVYIWNVTPMGSEGYPSEDNNFTIPSTIILNLVSNETDFGEVLNKYSYNTTEDDPSPFRVENTGNVMTDVRIRALDPLWDEEGLGTEYFRFMAGNSSETGSFNWTGSQTTWANVSSSSLDVIDHLNYSSAVNLAEVEIGIKVPAYEVSGSKDSVIVLSGVAS
ncbi:hypothetical protein GF351_00180, partial [Candidatus Woesearchaeota archaeon]|nr:hypothetical protein [Candidatus Woesearchaeota archaeon]